MHSGFNAPFGFPLFLKKTVRPGLDPIRSQFAQFASRKLRTTPGATIDPINA
jgi:hypothetical protein